MGDVRPKRSIIYDEIGDRLGRGRKAGRTQVSTPAGVSHETKRIALEHAKQVIVHRHLAEVIAVFKHEIEFLKMLDEWYQNHFPDAPQPSESGVDTLAEIIGEYYRQNGLYRPGLEPPRPDASGAIAEPMIDVDGRPMFKGRPRPRRKKAAVT